MKRSETACIIWSLLTMSAIRRQTITYRLLARLLGVARKDLARLLEPVQSYCILASLPPLTSLVVDSQSGVPGEGFIAAANLPRAQAETFAHDWLAENVPTPADFQRAMAALPSCGLSLGELLKQV